VPGGTVTFYGVRGSTPCDGPELVRYGGNSSCCVLETPGEPPVVFDLGTGVRSYGEALAARGEAAGFEGSVLLTHLHWDHTMGFPFFTPLLCGGRAVDIFGPRQEDGTLGDVFGQLMRQPFFPISPGDLPGDARFQDVGEDDFALHHAKVRSRWVPHTSPTLGFRVESNGIAVAYISDHGPGCTDHDDEFVPTDILDLADGVDLLIHDSQHTAEEYEGKRTWGHCTVDYAVHVAREAGARRLALFHHDPVHTDRDVDKILLHARELVSRRGGPDVIAAAEGCSVDLGHAVS
jgi:phosphoribosyl 1,2-cyclic phosphodiesterase